MNPTILGVIGPGFLNQVPTLYSRVCVCVCHVVAGEEGTDPASTV